jgi:transposase
MPRDRKAEALSEQGVLNVEPERVTDELFRTHDFFDPRDLVQVKYEMLRRVERDGVSVTEAAHAFGFSRPTFYQARNALERDGLAGLLPKRPGPRMGHKLTEEIADFLENERQRTPRLDAAGLARRVREQYGVSLHPRTIERALARKKKRHQAR